MPPEDPREKHLRECREKYPYRPAEQDLIDEQARKKCDLPSVVKTADQGVLDMQARIDMLKGDKAKALNALDDAEGPLRTTLLKDLDELNRDLHEAETRLTEYKAQQGLN
jgi:hypothetical protein